MDRSDGNGKDIGSPEQALPPPPAPIDSRRNRAARRSLILGIFAALFAPTQFLTFIAICLGVAGAIYGMIGLRASFRGAPGRWMAILGLVLSVSLPGWFVWWLATGCGQGC